MIAALAYGPVADEQWGLPERAVDFFDVKGDLESLFGDRRVDFERDEHPALHPGRCAAVVVDGERIGWIGTLHPALQQALDLPHAPVLFEVSMEALERKRVPKFEDVSRFPPVVRDLALVVDEAVPARRLLDSVAAAVASAASGSLVRDVRLFDEYRGKGLENKEKSLAIRIWMQDTSRTLNDSEVSSLISEIVEAAGRDVGARLRSGA